MAKGHFEKVEKGEKLKISYQFTDTGSRTFRNKHELNKGSREYAHAQALYQVIHDLNLQDDISADIFHNNFSESRMSQMEESLSPGMPPTQTHLMKSYRELVKEIVTKPRSEFPEGYQALKRKPSQGFLSSIYSVLGLARTSKK